MEIEALKKRQAESCEEGRRLISQAQSDRKDLVQLKNRSVFARNLKLFFGGPQESAIDSDAIKARKRILGTKQIMSTIKDSKLVVISKSVSTSSAKKIAESAQDNNVPLVHFNDTSVILGKLCGLPFRVSAISLSALSNASVQAILKEYETK